KPKSRENTCPARFFSSRGVPAPSSLRRIRSTAHQKPSDHRFEDGGLHLADQQHLSRSAVPSTENQLAAPSQQASDSLHRSDSGGEIDCADANPAPVPQQAATVDQNAALRTAT